MLRDKIWVKTLPNGKSEVSLTPPKALKGYETYTRLQKEKCMCDGWGCTYCCSSDAEIRARQGVFG